MSFERSVHEATWAASLANVYDAHEVHSTGPAKELIDYLVHGQSLEIAASPQHSAATVAQEYSSQLTIRSRACPFDLS